MSSSCPVKDDKTLEAKKPCRKCKVLPPLLGAARWAALVLVLAAGTLIFTPLGDVLGRQFVVIDPPAKADYIVILGGANERAVEAARLYRDGWAPKVIVSSKGRDANHLAEMARLYGLPEGVVVLDGKPRRTADHPRTIAQLPGVDKAKTRLIVVTSLFHTSRVRACFLKAGYRNVLMAGPGWLLKGRTELPRHVWKQRAANLVEELYESLAWAMYKLRGWL